MKKVLLSLFLFITCFSATAQRNFQPGYIVQKNDTIRGLVDQRGDKRSAAKVNFKKTEDSPVEMYTPDEIQGYGILNGPKFETQRLGEGSSSELHFLTLLVKGKASLYYFRDKDTNDHLYLLHQDSLQELTTYDKIETVNGKRVVVPYKLYRGTLYQAFKDCPAVMTGTKNLPYSQKAFMEIISRYNQCGTPASATYVAHPRELAILWGVEAGGTTANLTVEGGSSPTKDNQKVSSTLAPALGLFLNASLPWINPKLSLHGELLYTRTYYSKNFSEQINTIKKDYDLLLDLHYVKLPIQLRYTFPTKVKIKPFVNAGIIYSYAIKYKQELTTATSFSFQENMTVKKEPYMEDFGKFSRGFTFGGGVLFPAWSKHLFTLEGRYENGNGFSQYTGISTTTSQLYLLLGLTL